MPPLRSQGKKVKLMPANDAGAKRRKDIRFRRQMAFEHHCEAAGKQFSMIARHRHNAAFAGVESDRGEVRRSIALSLRLDR